jgi:hypothetical protein
VHAGHLLPVGGAVVRLVLCVFRRENSGFGGWGTSQSTCYIFIADLLFLSEVSHSLLVAGAPLRTPLFREMGPEASPHSRGPGEISYPLGARSFACAN